MLPRSCARGAVAANSHPAVCRVRVSVTVNSDPYSECAEAMFPHPTSDFNIRHCDGGLQSVRGRAAQYRLLPCKWKSSLSQEVVPCTGHALKFSGRHRENPAVIEEQQYTPTSAVHKKLLVLVLTLLTAECCHWAVQPRSCSSRAVAPNSHPAVSRVRASEQGGQTKRFSCTSAWRPAPTSPPHCRS